MNGNERTFMRKELPFNDHTAEYEAWYDRYPHVFRSEVEALREMLPEGDQLTGIEVGAGTGRFSQALGINEGIEPASNMRALAVKRGIKAVDGMAERLPYADLRFDFVLMNFLICYLEGMNKPFKEAFRVLKHDGVLIVGFIDKNSIIGRHYEKRKQESAFYKYARFYPVEKVLSELTRAGFRDMKLSQTLFHALDDIREFQPAKPGYGEGSYVVVKAMKQPSAGWRIGNSR